MSKSKSFVNNKRHLTLAVFVTTKTVGRVGSALFVTRTPSKYLTEETRKRAKVFAHFCPSVINEWFRVQALWHLMKSTEQRCLFIRKSRKWYLSIATWPPYTFFPIIVAGARLGCALLALSFLLRPRGSSQRLSCSVPFLCLVPQFFSLFKLASGITHPSSS